MIVAVYTNLIRTSVHVFVIVNTERSKCNDTNDTNAIYL